MFTFDILYGTSTAASRMFGPRDALPSLLDRTSALIASSWHITKTSLSILPRDLYGVLLGQACRALLAYKPGAPGLCLKHIVQRWPCPVLKLGSIVTRYKLDLKGHNKMTELIMHVVSGVCQPESQCKLTVLDLSDISMNGDTCLKVLQKIFASLNNRTLTVVLDLIVDAENYKPIKRLLRESRKCNSGSLRVQCCRLTINSLGKDRTAHVISLIEHQVVVALNLDLNRLENPGFSAILPAMVKFPNLETLSLTYNLISTTRDQTITQTAAEAFSKLHHLRRLSLSHNILTGSLRVLLESLTRPLECLYVCKCKLSSPDLSYLANSRHAKSLKELDLGSNNLKHGAVAFEKLLSDAGKTLEYLGLDDTHLSLMDSPVKLWARASQRLCKLIALSMRGNDFTPVDQIAVLKTLANNAPRLVYVGICMVYEPQIEDDDDFFFDFDELDVSNDRVNQFFELYYEGRYQESNESTEKERGKKRSLIVHDLDVENKRDAYIFIHNLETKEDIDE